MSQENSAQQKDEFLFEDLHLSLTGKLFLAGLGAWAVGKVVNTALRGTSSEVKTIANALMSSRRFQDELNKPGATVKSVMEKLRVKQLSAQEFERVLGIRWPL